MTTATPLWLRIWRLVRDGWMKFSHAIGLVMSSIFLTILWVVVFGLYAIILKVFSVFKKKYRAETYWWNFPEEQIELEHQF